MSLSSSSESQKLLPPPSRKTQRQPLRLQQESHQPSALPSAPPSDSDYGSFPSQTRSGRYAINTDENEELLAVAPRRQSQPPLSPRCRVWLPTCSADALQSCAYLGKLLYRAFSAHGTFLAYVCLSVLFVPLALAPFVALQHLDVHAELYGTATAEAEGFFNDVSFYDYIGPQNRTVAFAWQGVLSSLVDEELGSGILTLLFVFDGLVFLCILVGMAMLASSEDKVRNTGISNVVGGTEFSGKCCYSPGWNTCFRVLSACCFLVGLLFLCWTVVVPSLCHVIGEEKHLTHRERFEFPFESESENIQGKAWANAFGSASAHVTCGSPFGMVGFAALVAGIPILWLGHIFLQVWIHFDTIPN